MVIAYSCCPDIPKEQQTKRSENFFCPALACLLCLLVHFCLSFYLHSLDFAGLIFRIEKSAQHHTLRATPNNLVFQNNVIFLKKYQMLVKGGFKLSPCNIVFLCADASFQSNPPSLRFYNKTQCPLWISDSQPKNWNRSINQIIIWHDLDFNKLKLD